MLVIFWHLCNRDGKCLYKQLQEVLLWRMSSGFLPFSWLWPWFCPALRWLRPLNSRRMTTYPLSRRLPVSTMALCLCLLSISSERMAWSTEAPPRPTPKILSSSLKTSGCSLIATSFVVLRFMLRLVGSLPFCILRMWKVAALFPGELPQRSPKGQRFRPRLLAKKTTALTV